MSERKLEFGNAYNLIPSCKDTRFSYKDSDIYQLQLPMRLLVIGASGTMKTAWVLELIRKLQAFTRVEIYAKDLNEPLYSYIRAVMKKVCVKNKDNTLYKESDDINDFPDFQDPNVCHLYNKDEQTLFIIDDMMLEKQKNILKSFIAGRRAGISMIYVAQSYAKVPKDIRRNSDYLLLKRQNQAKDLETIYKEYFIPVSLPDFKKLYERVILSPKDGLFLDNVHTNPDYRLRINLTPLSQCKL